MGALIGMTTADDDLSGYLIGEMVGDAVGHGIAANEKTTFKKNYGPYYSSLRGRVPKDLTSMVTKGVEAQVNANPFFGPRLKDQGSHQFSMRNKHHFLSRNRSDPATNRLS